VSIYGKKHVVGVVGVVVVYQNPAVRVGHIALAVKCENPAAGIWYIQQNPAAKVL
jgi:hypothetical protein